MKIELYYLLLGSNLNHPFEQLKQACSKLAQEAGEIKKYSGIYQSAAWGKEDQNDFLNQIVVVNSHLSPWEMLRCIQQIELEMGRQREVRWGERTIDIDILYADSLIIQNAELTIPHPEIQNRRFTLVPLNEVAPEFIHPSIQKTNSELLAACVDPLPVTRYILNASA